MHDFNTSMRKNPIKVNDIKTDEQFPDRMGGDKKNYQLAGGVLNFCKGGGSCCEIQCDGLADCCQITMI